jgi:hypothetical protein
MTQLPYTGRLLNAIILLVVALSAFSLSITILRTKNRDKKLTYFGYFWLATALLWASSTIRNIFAAFDALGVDYFFFHLTQTLLYISGACLGPYMALKKFKNEILINIITYVYWTIGALGIIFVLLFGIERGNSDNFNTEYIPNIFAEVLFIYAVVPLIILGIADIIMHAYRYIARAEPFYETLTPLSIVAYLLIGIVDERGILVNWHLSLFRLVFVAAFFMAYAAFLQEMSDGAKKDQTTTFEI